jgi:hypothetical protein
MPYYRIRIDELNNGETRYMPQEGSLVIHRGWLSQRPEIQWQDLLNGEGFIKESDALKMIEHTRGYREKKEGKQVKSSKYKNID